VGDQGTSFGPFQLHVGGALPKGKGAAWAGSDAGILYAMQRMAQSGAKGLSGKAAVTAISSRFERPADVAGEIGKAMSFYGQDGSTPGPITATPGAAPSTPADTRRQALLAFSKKSVGAFINNKEAPPIKGLIDKMHGSVFAVDHNEPLSPNANSAVGLAKQYLGTKYQWGGSSPKGFDCSGFVQYVYGKQGVKLGRTTYDQIKQGTPVNKQQLQPGDVVFFSKSGDVHHEGMYIGDNQFIHAPHTGDVVKISSLSDPYYSQQFAGGRRMH
jgi:cell wall-associated NlpC family hydrolase